jgi:hypothetical protein
MKQSITYIIVSNQKCDMFKYHYRKAQQLLHEH